MVAIKVLPSKILPPFLALLSKYKCQGIVNYPIASQKIQICLDSLQKTIFKFLGSLSQ